MSPTSRPSSSAASPPPPDRTARGRLVRSPGARDPGAPYDAGVRVTHLDHVVLRVTDTETTLAWYRDVLGLEPLRLEEWRRGEAPFPSVRVDDGTIIDLLPGRRTGENMDHLCLVVAPQDLEAVVTSGTFRVLDGPAPRFGARGVGTSVYVADPEGNVVELRHYG